jgi:predicted permease
VQYSLAAAGRPVACPYWVTRLGCARVGYHQLWGCRPCRAPLTVRRIKGEAAIHQIILIFTCLVVGVVLRLTGRLPGNATKVLGGFVINVALPAAALRSVHELALHPDWWLAAATPWIGAVLAIVVIVPLCRALGWKSQRAGALLLVAGWGNTSFVGLPMITAFAGGQWLGLGIVIDLFGSYLALSTLGLAVASVASAGKFHWRAVARRIVTFPPFIAILVAFATNHLGRPDGFKEIVEALADTLTPIALAAVGFALRLDHLSGRLAALAVALGFRLVVAPLAIVLMYLALGGAGDPVAKVAMLEMAMPPMLGASIIAIDNDLEPDLVALVIGIGVPLSMLTASAWWSIVAGL